MAPRPLNVIAFDLATKTGVAVGASNDAPTCQTLMLGKQGSQHGGRFMELAVQTNRLIAEHKPDLIAIEAPFFKQRESYKERKETPIFLAGLRAMVALQATVNRIRFVEFSVADIRRHFIGSANRGRSSAKTSVYEICEMFGWPVSNTDEADACAVWEMARASEKLSSLPVGMFSPG